jgi:hypothetical protein
LVSSRPGPGTAATKFKAMIADAVKNVEKGERAARTSSARIATEVTRLNAARTRLPDAGERPGRPAGHLSKRLRWRAMNVSMVGFDLAAADTQSRYWIIQEIGTNERATIFTPNDPNPVGRPKTGAAYIAQVRSQVGRRVPRGLAFGTAPGGKFQLPGAARGEQIYPIETLTNVPPWAIGRVPRIRIRREIQGKHMVKLGGEAGFRQYRQEVLAAAQQAFAGHPNRG